MTVIAEITVPAETFMLGSLLADRSEIEIELERIVPLREGIMPLLWISGVDPAVIETRLREHPQTDAVERVTTADRRALFEIRWCSAVNGLVQALVDTHAHILAATGSADCWDLRLRFGSHEDLSAFNVALTGNNTPVTLRQVYSHSVVEDQSTLSDIQRETLLAAYHQGYFEVPRRTTLTELADAEGISDSALSQRIRRGMDGLVEQTLLDDHRES
jgi:predicted DNA binding protein